VQLHYANMPIWFARVLVLMVIALAALAVTPHKAMTPVRANPGDYHDTVLYRTMTNNVVEGKGYYSTIGAEHRAHGYPTSPPQVFREPTLAWLLAILRFEPIRLACLLLLATTVILQLYHLLLSSNLTASGRVAFVAAASTGLGFVATKDAAYLHEVWASLLLALSLLLYRENRWLPSVVIAVSACLIRELALPYLLVMATWALSERKWHELIGWTSGIATFAVLFALHLILAAQLHRPGDAISESWFALGGWQFALETARFNILLHDAPLPITAILVCCAVVGLAGARDSRAQRAAFIASAYLAAFTIVGRPGNYYWGIMYTPMLSIGFAYAPIALRNIGLRVVGQKYS
jgi:hypothetical protein